jgi:hypothetical protein
VRARERERERGVKRVKLNGDFYFPAFSGEKLCRKKTVFEMLIRAAQIFY